MKTISFTKMSGSGNDFIVIDTLQPASRRGSIYRIPSGRINPAPTIDLQPAKLAKQFCRRRLSIGADGLL
ncbi:MAG: hypothetical protein U9R31_02400, partial [Candidatus Omnitrophota bacterium]|nr:hypothetical protein [Candidatus Omnitrophota bacterium]